MPSNPMVRCWASPSPSPSPSESPIESPSPSPSAASITCGFTGPTSLNTGEVGTFTSTSVTTSGTIDSYTWTASGGDPLSGIASTFAWSSGTAGTYTITLTVTSVDGTAACSADVVVTAPTGGVYSTPAYGTPSYGTPSNDAPYNTPFTPVVPQAGPVTGGRK